MEPCQLGGNRSRRKGAWVFGLVLFSSSWIGFEVAGQSATLQEPACEGKEHQALLDRLERLESLVGSLQEQLESREASPEGVLVANGGPESQRDTIASDEMGSGAMDQGETGPETFQAKTVYLPSRGWNAAWLGSPERKFEVRAFLDLEYIDAEPEGARSGVSTFDNHHTQIFLRSRLGRSLEAHAELEWEHSGSQVEVDQAFVSWAVADALTLDFGRFYNSFGIERFVWYSPTNELVSRPEPFRSIVPNNFYSNGLRASGAFGKSGSRMFTYEVAVSDGLGDDVLEGRRGSRQDRDNNSSRALAARISFSPNSRVEVGVSHHGQRYSTEGDLDLRFFGLDLAARWQGFEWRSEWVDAELDRATTDGAGGLSLAEPLDQRGWYSQLTYTFDWDRRLLPSLTLATRYDSVDLDRGLVDAGTDYFSLGINAKVFEQFRLKGEYRLGTEQGANRDNDSFLFQAVVDF
ncbi:MAG: porin [Deltaproteobacteria bacterium]|nr:porin [Deltaproteobacteria bacterium]